LIFEQWTGKRKRDQNDDCHPQKQDEQVLQLNAANALSMGNQQKHQAAKIHCFRLSAAPKMDE